MDVSTPQSKDFSVWLVAHSNAARDLLKPPSKFRDQRHNEVKCLLSFTESKREYTLKSSGNSDLHFPSQKNTKDPRINYVLIGDRCKHHLCLENWSHDPTKPTMTYIRPDKNDPIVEKIGDQQYKFEFEWTDSDSNPFDGLPRRIARGRFSNYRRGKKLGSGKYGTAYEAHIGRREVIAVKVFHRGLVTGDSRRYKKAIQEISNVTSLNHVSHNNIVLSILDAPFS